MSNRASLLERGVLPQVPVTADVEALRAPIGAVDATLPAGKDR